MNDNLTTATNTLYYTTATPATSTSTRTTNIYADTIMNVLDKLKYNTS